MWEVATKRARGLIRGALLATLAAEGALLAWRMIAGPIDRPVHVYSPLNLEIGFALCGLLLALLSAEWKRDPPAPVIEQDGRGTLLAFGVIALTTAAAFGWTARSYFLSDDFLILKHAAEARVHPSYPFWIVGGDGFYRPVGYVLLGLNSACAGISPAAWHWTGFAIHALNAALVVVLGASLGLSRFGSLFAGLLFTLHGTRPEAALWVAGRFDLLATLFALIALVAFTRSLTQSRMLLRSASAIAMILAILCKESAYAVPLMLAWIAWRQRAVWAAAPHIAIAAALFAGRWLLLGGLGGYPGAGTPAAFDLFKALALRLWAILFVPVNWAIAPGLWLGLAMVLYTCALMVLLSAPALARRMAAPIGLLVLGALPPVQQLLIGVDLQKSRLLYLPSIGLFLLLGVLSEALPFRRRLATAAAILLFQSAALEHNLQAWTYAAAHAKQVCEAAAMCQPTRVEGLPGSLHGVYFFANGFEECVAMQPPGPRKECHLEWDPTTDSVR